MDLKDKLKQLSERAEKMLPQITTEEATKNALIMPFINILGYDVFDPLEVTPEFVADLGIKKGEKVDYAIMKDGKPIILIECKHHGEKLDPHNSQLFRYFHTTEAKFGLLTNGVVFRFYTDLDQTNKMDEKPFLEFSLLNMKEPLIEEIKKFHKSYFNIEQIVSTASELKYTNAIRSLIQAEYNNPSEEFTRYFTRQVYQGVVTSKVLSQFTPIVKKSFTSLVSDMITERLTTALNNESDAIKKESEEIADKTEEPTITEESRVVTTQTELEAYYIIRSILRGKVDIQRVHYRDAQTYFSVLYDDNNRKPICRLFLNGSKMSVVTFDKNRKESKFELQQLDDIYNYSEALIGVAELYEKA